MAPSAGHSFAFAVVLLTSGLTSEFLAPGFVSLEAAGASPETVSSNCNTTPMELIILLILFGSYTISLFIWDKRVQWRLRPTISRRLPRYHYIGLVLILFIVVIHQFDISIRGLWTSRIIILSTILLGIIIRFIADKSSISRLEMIYFKVFAYLPVGLFCLFLIPFIGPVLVISFVGQLFNPIEKLYYEDKSIRVQSTFTGILVPASIDVYEKALFFEKHIKRLDQRSHDVDSISVSYNPGTHGNRQITLFLYNDSPGINVPTERIDLK